MATTLTLTPTLPGKFTNYVSNPSFETNTTGWVTNAPVYHLNSGASLARTSANAKYGDYCGRVTTPGSAAAEGIAFALPSGWASGSGTYYASVWLYSASAVSLDVVLGKASADHAKADVTLTAGVWQQATVSWTPNTAAAIAYLIVRTDFGGGPQAATIDVDAALVAYPAGVSASQFFDGDQPGGEWTGVPHGSISTGHLGVPLELNDRDPWYVAADGLGLPIVSYDEEYAESIYSEGGRRTRSRPQNPEGKVSLLMSAGLSDAQVQTALSELQQTVEAARTYGGVLTAMIEDAPTVHYDLESVSISALDPSQLQFQRSPVELSMTTRPYGRLNPVSLVSNSTSSDPIQSVSLADIPGSAPALVKATVTDTATQNRDHLEVGLDAAWDGTAALLIDSASLSTTGLAGSATTRTGAYSSSGVIRTSLATSPLGCCEATGLTHKGRHKVKARLYGDGTGPIYVRLAWRVGSGGWSRSSWRQLQGLDAFYELDLGYVEGSEDGTLTVRVEAYSDFGDTLDVDYLLMIPAYLYAKAKGETDAVAATVAAYDLFNQADGNLDAPKAADLGGNWAEANKTAGDGFQVEDADHTLRRTKTGDSYYYSGCFAYLGSTVAGCSVKVELKFSRVPTLNWAGPYYDSAFGVLARYGGTNTWLALLLRTYWVIEAGWVSTLALLKNVSGTITALQEEESAFYGVTNYWYKLQLDVAANGTYVTYINGLQWRTGYDADLATGGALDDGKCGIYDAWTDSASCTRYYNNYLAMTPSSTATTHVVDASGAVILGSDSIARADGTRPPQFEGSYLTCPPAGREDRTHRLAVKMRRADVDTSADANIADGQRVDVTVTPRVVLL